MTCLNPLSIECESEIVFIHTQLASDGGKDFVHFGVLP